MKAKWWRYGTRTSIYESPERQYAYDKSEYITEQEPYYTAAAVAGGEPLRHTEVGTGYDLKRGLHARHIVMIAIGGAISTRLIIGTGAALGKAGPGSIFISYLLVGMLVYMVMCALGEMATWLPTNKNFAGYATRVCDPALGFALGYVSITKTQTSESFKQLELTI